MLFANFTFFFNDTATTEIYTLSLHDALPIFNDDIPDHVEAEPFPGLPASTPWDILAQSDKLIAADWELWNQDRKSTRLNSSHANISYAVFCLKINQFTNPN